MKKILNNKKAIAITILFIIILVSTIFIKKYNLFYDNRTEIEIKNNVIIVKDGKVDKSNDGKLVLVSGNLNYNNEVLHDDIFNIHITTSKLYRYVEMYQCYEHVEVDNKGNKIYKHDYIWASGIIDSSNYTDSNCKNPKKKTVESKFYYSKVLKVGDYDLNKKQKEELSCGLRTNINPNINLPDGYKVYDNFITNSEDPKNPKIGDIRIAFLYNTWPNITILAKQSKNTFTDYKTKNNELIDVIHSGVFDLQPIINYMNEYILKK